MLVGSILAISTLPTIGTHSSYICIQVELQNVDNSYFSWPSTVDPDTIIREIFMLGNFVSKMFMLKNFYV